MNDENELLEPLATEAGQEAIVRAIRDISSLEYAVRAEQAASQASAKAGEASQSAIEASDAEDKAKDWATKTDTYVEQQIITIPPAQEGEEPTTETINLYSAKYYAALAQDIYNNMSFDSVPTENSTNMVNSGTVYSALDLKADKSTTYTKTETDNLINTRLAELVASAPAALDTLQELATALGNDPNFATTIATQLGNKADKSTTYTKTEVDTALSNVQSTLTFDSTPTANSTNPVTSGGIYTALQNVNIDIDDEITEDSDNPVTSAAIYEALQNFTPSGGGGGAGNASGVVFEELYDGGIVTPETNTNIVFNNNWTDYDLILFQFGSVNKVDKLVSKQAMNQIKGDTSKKIWFDIYNGNWYFSSINVINDNTISFEVSHYSLNKIYGIKFSKNLSEQMYSNVLYENSSGWSSGSITLSDSLDNYDFIQCDYRNAGDPSLYTNSNIFDARQLLDGRLIAIVGYANRYFNITVTSSTVLTLLSRGDYVLTKITGYKLAKGGYSGIVSDARMTVKSGDFVETNGLPANNQKNYTVTFDSPMPDNNYMVSVSFSNKYGDNPLGGFEGYKWAVWGRKTTGFTIGIFPTNNITGTVRTSWIAIRPNSYTREGMVEDVLYATSTGFTTGTINLSGNISDYDLLEFILTYDNATDYNFSRIVDSTTFMDNDKYNFEFQANRYFVCTVPSDSSITCLERRNIKITKITGIKFGRYVSGVAVDTTVTQNSNAVITSGAVYDALQNAGGGGGGGSSVTVDSSITQNSTNPVESAAIYAALAGKQDSLTFDSSPTQNSDNPVKSGGVYTALAAKGDVTTNTDQNITGTKTFVGSKKVAFKQSTANDKLGFTLYGNTGTERGYLEFNPTNTVDGVTGLMTLGNYATSAAALTQVGFRRYSNISGASGAYNLLMPMVADARTPFSLTTSYTNFYLPLGFKNGSTIVKTDKSGVVDISPLLASLEARVAALEGN